MLGCAALGEAPLRAAEGPTNVEANAPWKIQRTTPVQFPLRLLRSGVTQGDARVRVSVSAAGELIDSLLVACSQREFGDEALRAVRAWRFEPERVNGTAVGVVAELTFAFVTNGPVAVEYREPTWTDEASAGSDGAGFHAAGMKTLDRIPDPTKIVPPVFPDEWRARGITGSATVEFYIDETGRVRIPLVKSATHPELGASAIAAVSQWRFAPPTRRGQRVLARVEQVFRFE